MQYHLNPEPIALEKYEEIKNKGIEAMRSEIRWTYELLLQASDMQIRQLRNLHRYYKAAQPIGYIDYDSWIKECPDQKTAEFIDNLSKIQPRLVI